MNCNELTSYCLSKKEAYLDFPFGETPACIKVCGRIFAQIYPGSKNFRITLKCEPMLADFYRKEYPGIVLPGYHVPNAQKIYWNTVVVSSVPKVELLRMIDHSYEQVVKKFSKAMRRNVEID